MNCEACKIKLECSKLMPFECFMCVNGHLQCSQCNVRCNECCRVCGTASECVVLVSKAYFGKLNDVPAGVAQPEVVDLIDLISFDCSPSAPDEAALKSAVPQRDLNIKDYKKQEHGKPLLMGHTNNDKKSDVMGLEAARIMSEAFDGIEATAGCSTKKPMQNETSTSSNSVVPSKLQNSNPSVFPKIVDNSNTVDTHRRNKCNASNLVHQIWPQEPITTLNVTGLKRQLAHCEINRNIGPAPSQQSPSNVLATKSAPSLIAVQPDLHLRLHSKFQKQDYVVMHAAGIRNHLPKVIKDVNMNDKDTMPYASFLDVCLQKILKTYQEDTAIPKSGAKLDVTKDQKIKPSENEAIDKSQENNLKGQDVQNASHISSDKVNILARPMHIQRALYKPPAHDLVPLLRSIEEIPTAYAAMEEPPAQFERIMYITSVENNPILSKPQTRYSVAKAYQLLPPMPIQCPGSQCSMMVFFTDFRQHFAINHCLVPQERMWQRQCKNFLLDPELRYHGGNNCHYLYFLMDKTDDEIFDHNTCFLPLVVMSSRITISEPQVKPPVECLIVWVTGVVPKKLPVQLTLSVWSRTSKIPSSNLTYSGPVYSMRKSQKPWDVYRSGQMLMLSPFEVSRLSNNYKEMLTIQLMAEMGDKLQN